MAINHCVKCSAQSAQVLPTNCDWFLRAKKRRFRFPHLSSILESSCFSSCEKFAVKWNFSSGKRQQKAKWRTYRVEVERVPDAAVNFRLAKNATGPGAKMQGSRTRRLDRTVANRSGVREPSWLVLLFCFCLFIATPGHPIQCPSGHLLTSMKCYCLPSLTLRCSWDFTALICFAFWSGCSSWQRFVAESTQPSRRLRRVLPASAPTPACIYPWCTHKAKILPNSKFRPSMGGESTASYVSLHRKKYTIFLTPNLI